MGKRTKPEYLEPLLPPQNIELEDAVLGAILLEQDAWFPIADIFSPDLFYKEQNQIIAEAIITLKNNNEGTDILMVTTQLKKMGKLEYVGGSYYVSGLTNRIASSANIQFHARILMQEAIKREAIISGTTLIKKSFETASDCFDVIDEWEKSLTAITSKLFTSKSTTSLMLCNKVLEHNKLITTRINDVIGVPSGFVDIDRLMAGWQKSDLLILAARPGMGKTALALRWARHAAIAKKPTAIFSMEMSETQLYKRLCSQETDIPLDQFTKTGMDADTVTLFNRDMEELKHAPLFIDDAGGLTIFELRNKARKLKREENIELIIIDYLQLMSGTGKEGNREQEVSVISRGLKSLAKELDIPIIALSQLSRTVESRPGSSKIPQLSDLRDSGAIEQDADIVFFIYRPEYYGIMYDSNNNSTIGLAKLIIAKNRHGALEEIDLKWIGSCTKFTDYND